MTPSYPRLREWWTDDPADPGRPLLDDPDVQRLVAAIDPESQPTDLGGVMSLNVRLHTAGLVLRVHQPFVSRRLLLALQQVRCRLIDQGLLVPPPMRWKDAAVFRCRNRWAELEGYLPHRRPARTLESYAWMFGEMGVLHRALACLDLAVPRPLVATYAPPGSLRRWLPVTEAAVRGDAEAAEIARLLRALVRQLRGQWLPATELPTQYVHGDMGPRNVCRTLEGRTVYFDFGFFARRPRVHDLVYALAFMLLALDAHLVPECFDWACVPPLAEQYEAGASVCLTRAEKRALAPYTASVPLYAAALDGFTEDPAGRLRSRLPFLRLSEWLLAHSTRLLGKKRGSGQDHGRISL